MQDDDATDEDSDEEFHRVVVTPRLKQHTSRLQDPAFIEGIKKVNIFYVSFISFHNYFIQGVNHLRKTPINLGLKQFDRNTPNRILQVAMENSHDQDFCGFTPETQSVSAKNKDAFKKNEVQEKEKLFNS